MIAYLGFDDEGRASHMTHAWLLDREPGETRNLTVDFDRSVGSVRWFVSPAVSLFIVDTGLFMHADHPPRRTKRV